MSVVANISEEEISVLDRSGVGSALMARAGQVRNWLRREGKSAAVSAGIGMATNILTAKVAMAAAPLWLAAGAGMLATNLVTSAYRMVKENAAAEREELFASGASEKDVSGLKLFLKHATQDDILNKKLLKRTVSGFAISVATFGVFNFQGVQNVMEGGSDFLSIKEAAAAAPFAAPIDPSVSMENLLNPDLPPQDYLSIDLNQPQDPFAAGHASVQPAEIPAVDASVVAIEPVSAMSRVQDLLQQDQALPEKVRDLLERAADDQINAQKMKDAAQALVKVNKDLAIDLYGQAVDLAQGTGQKTAWAQASIDLAYLTHAAAPDEALAQMQDVAGKTRGALHKIAQEFVDQWKGVHPMDVAPVDVVQHKVAAVAENLIAETQSVDLSSLADQNVSPVSGNGFVSIGDEFARAQQALSENYTRENLLAKLSEAAGKTYSSGLNNFNLAGMLHPENPQDLLDVLENQAPQLDPNRLAGVCVTDIPRDVVDVPTVPTYCVAVKDVMNGGDFVTVRDSGDSSPRGLRIAFKEAAAKVTDFISNTVVPEVVTAMHGEVLMGRRP